MKTSWKNIKMNIKNIAVTFAVIAFFVAAIAWFIFSSVYVFCLSFLYGAIFVVIAVLFSENKPDSGLGLPSSIRRALGSWF
jgi:ABC-type siderophore export system fused ATPase/permease subunit